MYNKEQYPFMLYTFDWLGFAHIVIAILLIAPMKDPIKSLWVIEFAIISCITTFSAIFIFGIIGAELLFCCEKEIQFHLILY